jgi:hypothetical protein
MNCRADLVNFGFMGAMAFVRFRSVLFLKPLAYPKAMHETCPMF